MRTLPERQKSSASGGRPAAPGAGRRYRASTHQWADVRSRWYTGKHLLDSSFSGRDPGCVNPKDWDAVSLTSPVSDLLMIHRLRYGRTLALGASRGGCAAYAAHA